MEKDEKNIKLSDKIKNLLKKLGLPILSAGFLLNAGMVDDAYAMNDKTDLSNNRQYASEELKQASNNELSEYYRQINEAKKADKYLIEDMRGYLEDLKQRIENNENLEPEDERALRNILIDYKNFFKDVKFDKNGGILDVINKIYITSFDIEKNMKIERQKSESSLYMVKEKNSVWLQSYPSANGKEAFAELGVNDISSLSLKQLESLGKKYNISTVYMHTWIDEETVYPFEDYKKVLKAVDERFGDLKNNNKLSELEKVMVVLKRMKDIKYDDGATRCNSLDEKSYTSRNMYDPLFNNTALCAGYAHLFKNVMSYIGMFAKEIGGISEQPEIIFGVNHAWNQVKVNGKWYNLDVTAVVDKNKQRLENGNEHSFLLVSDRDFCYGQESNGEKYYSPIEPVIGLHEMANESISDKELNKAIKVADKYEKKRNKSLKIDSQRNVKTESLDLQRRQFESKLSKNGEYANLGYQNIERQDNYSKNKTNEENER